MINVTIGESKPQEKPFPKLMIWKDQNLIVYFIKSKTGVVINKGNSPYELFDKQEYFGMDFFTDFNEPITLQNA